MNPGEWREMAACRGKPVAWFWPQGDRHTPLDFEPALRVCWSCPVLGPCRAEAEVSGDIVNGYTTHGQVRGGCAPYSRTATRANRAKEAYA